MDNPKTDFLYALLALDAYNRHDDEKLRNISNTDGKQLSADIGTIKFEVSSDVLENRQIGVLQGSQASGFSASQYSLGEDTIIAYRGTDFPNEISLSAFGDFFADVLNGWAQSFNAIDSETIDLTNFNNDKLNFQPYFARQFYDLVTGNKVFPSIEDGEQPSDVILTGHSLGGSLAGFVGSLTDNQTVVFNELPFLGAALTSSINNFYNQNISLENNNIEDGIEATIQILNGDPVNVEGATFSPFINPDVDSVSSFRMTGEIAGLARLLGPILGNLSSQYISVLTDRLNKLKPVDTELDLGPITNVLSLAYAVLAELNIETETVSSFAGLSGGIADGIGDSVNLHSQSLLTIDLFGRSEGHTLWQSLGRDRFDSLFNDEIANGAGSASFEGRASASSKLQIALAYSGLDQGNLIFGDTGIRAMFDDLNELGFIYGDDFTGEQSEFLNTRVQLGSSNDDIQRISQVFTDIAVQYAGALAFNKVERKDFAAEEFSGLDPTSGVFSTNAANTILTLDLSSVLWRDVLNASKKDGDTPLAEPLDPIHRNLLLAELLSSATSSTPTRFLFNTALSGLDELALLVWGEEADDTVFDRLHFWTLDKASTGRIATGTLTERVYGPRPSDEEIRVDVYVGARQNLNDITGTSGNDLLIGGLLNDTIKGAAGDDAIFLGQGSDTYFDGLGDDFVEGGSFDPNEIDTISFNNPNLEKFEGVYVKFEKAESDLPGNENRFNIIANAVGPAIDFGTNTVQSIDRVELSSGDDLFRVSPDQDLREDLPDNITLEVDALGGVDTLDYSDSNTIFTQTTFQSNGELGVAKIDNIAFKNFTRLIAGDGNVGGDNPEDRAHLIFGIDQTTTGSVPAERTPRNKDKLLDEKFVREQLGLLTDSSTSLRDKFDEFSPAFTKPVIPVHASLH